MKTLVETCAVSKLKCLDYECREVLTDEQNRLILDDETYTRLKRYQTALEVDKDKDKIFCPNIKCYKVLSLKELKKENKGKKLVCKHCSSDICRKCHLLEHPGNPCANTNDGKFRMWATTGAGVKNCPVCGARTQKSSGCNHMHCERCQADWCWICGQTCNETHYEPTRIFTGCPGMQFIGGGGGRLALMLLAVFIFNPIVFALGPPLMGFLAGFYFAWEWTARSLSCSHCCDKCWVSCILAPFLFILYLALAQAIFLSLGALTAVLLVGFVSVPLMLYVIFFGGRIIYLNCRRLK